MISKYIKTLLMTAESRTSTGILYMLPAYFLRIVYLIPLILLWRTLMAGGVDTGMELNQMLTYTYMSVLLADLLSIESSLTNWITDGPLLKLYQRPMNIFGQVTAESLGKILPSLLFFSVPMMIISPIFNISLNPSSWWFLVSLILSVSISFATEFIFAALLIHMINASWLVISIRRALTGFFSGNFIPFAALPWGIGNIFKFMPLGSLGGAVLGIYTGLENPAVIIPIQMVWNVVLWGTAVIVFNKSRERMVSNGG